MCSSCCTPQAIRCSSTKASSTILLTHTVLACSKQLTCYVLCLFLAGVPSTPSALTLAGGATPSVRGVPGATPMRIRDQLGLNEGLAAGEGASLRAQKAAAAALRSDLRAGLASLPAPENEYSIALPEMPDEEAEMEVEEDAADVKARKAREAEAARQAAEKKKSQVGGGVCMCVERGACQLLVQAGWVLVWCVHGLGGQLHCNHSCADVIKTGGGSVSHVHDWCPEAGVHIPHQPAAWAQSLPMQSHAADPIHAQLLLTGVHRPAQPGQLHVNVSRWPRQQT